jgi:hypothetical protein
MTVASSETMSESRARVAMIMVSVPLGFQTGMLVPLMRAARSSLSIALSSLLFMLGSVVLVSCVDEASVVVGDGVWAGASVAGVMASSMAGGGLGTAIYVQLVFRVCQQQGSGSQVMRRGKGGGALAAQGQIYHGSINRARMMRAGQVSAGVNYQEPRSGRAGERPLITLTTSGHACEAQRCLG